MSGNRTSIRWALELLVLLPKDAVATPEFKDLWDQLARAFGQVGQETLEEAYDLVLSDAADADMDLQDLVERNA